MSLSTGTLPFERISAQDSAHDSALHWYVIADSAQDPALPAVLDRPSRCLFDAAPGTPLAEQSPHLVSMASPADGDPAWQWIARRGPRCPCVTVIASALAFDALFDRLAACAEIRLPDGDDMFFAYWDPAILGTLVGQEDDPTLHVPGPVLRTEQRAYFAGAIDRWWYWDRAGALHEIRFMAAGESVQAAPFQLNQRQVDDLVEASMPDHVLYFVELNQPHLFYGFSSMERYGFVCRLLVEARRIGLESMRDLVNYVCVALIYKERIGSDPEIAAILADVSAGTLSFDQAMQRFP